MLGRRIVRAMSRGILSTATVASVIAFAFAAPAAADAAATPTCVKQTRAVASAKKSVVKAQKAKASTPVARKQRAKRVKVAKRQHARAKKALASCKAKVKAAPAPVPQPTPVPTPVPEPAPAPAPAPVPAPPLLALAATTVGPLQGFTATVAAPPLPAGMQYRIVLSITTSGDPTGTAACTKGVTWSNVPASGQKVLFGSRQWCVGSGTMSLHRASNDAHPSVAGELVLSIPVVVNPA